MHDLVGSKVQLLHIDTGQAKPVRKRPYRQSPEMQRAMDRIIDEMLAANILVTALGSSPCVRTLLPNL